MFHKFWRAPQPVKEPLLEESTQEEAEELAKELARVWGEFSDALRVLVVDEAIMRPRARAAGFDLKHFNFDPGDHPNLPQDLKDWCSCVKNALALKAQLISIVIRRELMKMQLEKSGSDKTSGLLQPQSTEFERFARRQLQEYKGFLRR